MTDPGTCVEFGQTSDGLTQLRRRWIAPVPRASLLLVHGTGEHSGRYDHVGSSFARAGIDVLAADNRGFGQTGGARGHVDRFDDFLDDLIPLVEERRVLGVPVILMGHSLGGLIVSAYLVSGRSGPDAAVLSAPALAAHVPRWQRLLAPPLARLRPTQFVPTTIRSELLSRDQAVRDAYVSDPLVVAGSTAGFGSCVFAAMRSTTASLDRITLPTYVLHGGDDGLVPPSASEPLGGLPSVERRVWPGLRHECLNEPERDEVLAAIVEWIDDQLRRWSGSSST